ncbi:leucyl-tRNA synthetase [Cellulomonas flavigena DSM 20109]|uniref:Leucine--tRNA ligase n=1 Tax=Cellulomonas flavigena (strain ATCC 482 / DSM 20109 / BCRC 11376 / JCM 18109 / NBRC 3775 / NCIMB 8073 / NRS 134) TaxID=446466 RepID=D5UGM7_CELFN|nr:leucine--tRNA ligase [Cellulomonas flavigena]ADG75125.1 leucyl-tRNA synthetase [Cellulomonas flavigena DSM 20109]
MGAASRRYDSPVSDQSPTPAPDDVPFRYTAALAEQIELRWQDEWEKRGTYFTPNPVGELTDGEGRHADPAARPFFVMDMFPYPSGAGLHVGHPLGYIATDVVGRFRRMCGDNVLHALAFDAFGLPAEQYAVQTGRHPRVTTEANIEIMQRQLRRLGLAHDPRRSFATIDPDYVRWTQWIFLQIFESWYDEDAVRPDGGTGRARPVSELVAEYEAGTRALPTDVEGVEPGATWTDLDAATRRRVVDSRRLAYLSQTPVNWAPGLGTVLANEEVTADGRSERGNFPVFQRSLRQWNMRITAYADRLTDDLDRIDWPEKVKAMQRHWIGRSTGARVRFAVQGGEQLEVFTTRPDTLFGATFLVVSPEHPLLDEVPAQWPDGTSSAWTGGHSSPTDAVADYRREAAAKTALERQQDAGRKTGVFTGHLATNPVNGELLPVFTADYVLMGYGTGAIMAVPGGDERDFQFAQAFGLPVVYTVDAPEGTAPGARTGDGAIINSANDEVSLDGLDVPTAKERIVAWLEEHGVGERTITYRLRDWLFSRQRYWGEPFPVVYDEDDTPIALPASALPVELPEVPDFSPRTYDPDDATSEPEPPLGRNTDWLYVELDLGDGPRRYRRDANTMPNWAGSCWYHLRYLDPRSDDALVDPALEDYWMGPGHGTQAEGSTGGVDLYVGGVEHAVLHLLYARFWHKVLYDLGHVRSAEPFHKLFNQGYIQGYAYTDERGVYVPAAEVVEDEASPTGFRWNGEPVHREYGKIGKSLKNAVSPDEMYEAYGADTLRVYEMSMGPLDLSRPWETRAVVGAQRFLQRLWRNVVDETTGELVVTEDAPSTETLRVLHRTIEGVREDMEGMRINTAIAKLIVLNNHVTTLERAPRSVVEALVVMTAPVAPHIAEELWARLGHERSVVHATFPQADPQHLVEETVTCVFQVQGKVRGRAEVAPSAGEDELRELALADAGVQRALAGRDVRTVIVRAPRLVNVVPA